MRVGQFNRRTPRNVIRGRKRSAGNKFNSSFKNERHPNPQQYAGKKVKEFNRVPEMKDLRARQSGEERGQSLAEQKQNRQRPKGRTQDMARKFARQIVSLAAGSVIITSSYQSMVEARNAERNKIPDQIVVVSDDTDPADGGTGQAQNNTEQTGKEDQTGTQDGNQSNTQGDGENGNNGISSKDSNSANENSGETAGNSSGNNTGDSNESSGESGSSNGNDSDNSDNSGVNSDADNRGADDNDSDNGDGDDSTGNGNSVPVWTWESDNSSATVQISGVGSATATITSTEDAALCTTAGSRTFTATAELNGKTYTDTRTETIPAKGHSFGVAQTTTNSDGTITMTYHCSECDQEFEITIRIAEE